MVDFLLSARLAKPPLFLMKISLRFFITRKESDAFGQKVGYREFCRSQHLKIPRVY